MNSLLNSTLSLIAAGTAPWSHAESGEGDLRRHFAFGTAAPFNVQFNGLFNVHISVLFNVPFSNPLNSAVVPMRGSIGVTHTQEIRCG